MDKVEQIKRLDAEYEVKNKELRQMKKDITKLLNELDLDELEAINEWFSAKVMKNE